MNFLKCLTAMLIFTIFYILVICSPFAILLWALWVAAHGHYISSMVIIVVSILVLLGLIKLGE